MAGIIYFRLKISRCTGIDSIMAKSGGNDSNAAFTIMANAPDATMRDKRRRGGQFSAFEVLQGVGSP